MTQEQWTAVDAYITDLLVSSDSALDAALEASAAASLPSINVTPNQGKLLQLLAQACGARKILELGTLGGYSTIWLARALPADGRLITLEYDPKHAEVAQSNITRAGLDQIVEVKVGLALDSLIQLHKENQGPFDLIFIDADKKGNPDYFQWALKLSRKGTVIITDNVVRSGQVVDETSTDPNIVGVRQFTEMVAQEQGVCGTVVQTVGSKGYDGFAIMLVTGEN